jgi:hypothetical protein
MLRKPSNSTSRPPKESNWIRILEVLVDGIRALAWPSLVVIALIVFYTPLQDIASNLATKLGDANKVSIGGLSLEIEAKVREQSSPELAKQVGSLSPIAIEELLRTSRSGAMTLLSIMSDSASPKLGLAKKPRIDALLELSSKGFIEFDRPVGPFLAELRSFPIDKKASEDSEHDWYLIPYAESSSNYQRFRRQGYKLTDKGKLASEAIVKAVSALLSRKET